MSIAPAERVETALEEIAALDFEPEVPCAPCARDGDGTVNAKWYLMRSCGCQPMPYCDECRRVARWMASRGADCAACLADSIIIRFEPLRQI